MKLISLLDGTKSQVGGIGRVRGWRRAVGTSSASSTSGSRFCARINSASTGKDGIDQLRQIEDNRSINCSSIYTTLTD